MAIPIDRVLANLQVDVLGARNGAGGVVGRSLRLVPEGEVGGQRDLGVSGLERGHAGAGHGGAGGREPRQRQHRDQPALLDGEGARGRVRLRPRQRARLGRRRDPREHGRLRQRRVRPVQLRLQVRDGRLRELRLRRVQVVHGGLPHDAGAAGGGGD